jgi:hypothetical protein
MSRSLKLLVLFAVLIGWTVAGWTAEPVNYQQRFDAWIKDKADELGGLKSGVIQFTPPNRLAWTGVELTAPGDPVAAQKQAMALLEKWRANDLAQLPVPKDLELEVVVKPFDLRGALAKWLKEHPDQVKEFAGRLRVNTDHFREQNGFAAWVCMIPDEQVKTLDARSQQRLNQELQTLFGQFTKDIGANLLKSEVAAKFERVTAELLKTHWRTNRPDIGSNVTTAVDVGSTNVTAIPAGGFKWIFPVRQGLTLLEMDSPEMKTAISTAIDDFVLTRVLPMVLDQQAPHIQVEVSGLQRPREPKDPQDPKDSQDPPTAPVVQYRCLDFVANDCCWRGWRRSCCCRHVWRAACCDGFTVVVQACASVEPMPAACKPVALATSVISPRVSQPIVAATVRTTAIASTSSKTTIVRPASTSIPQPSHEVSSQGIARFLTVSAASASIHNPPREFAPRLANEKFGIAFHAYWQGDYDGAIQVLGEAIEANSRDARCWYYLGLCERALNRTDAAEAALAQAVRLHAAMPAREALAVSKSIERVQGKLRQDLQRALLQAQIHPVSAAPTADDRIARTFP